MTRILFLVAFFFGAVVTSAQDWDASSKHLGALNADGTLWARIELGGIVLGNNFELVTLEHEVVLGLDGTASSAWVVPQLETWLLPAAQGLSLRLPGGWCVNYDDPGPVNANFKPGRSKDDPLIRRVDDTTVQFRLDSGNIYTYVAGRLQRLQLRDGRIFSVETAGARITSIVALNEPTEIFRARFNGEGRLENLTIGDNTFRFFHEPGTGLLLRVENAGQKSLLNLRYEARRIVRLEEAGKPPVTFAWSPSASYHPRGMRRYLDAPFTLTRVDDVNYRFEIDIVHSRTILQRIRPGAPVDKMTIDWLTGVATTSQPSED